MAQIRVLIVDDSLFFRTFLARALSREPSIEIVGSIGDPVDAASRIGTLQPNVIAVDMEMPRMRGNDFLRTVLPKYPNVRAVMLSSLSGNVFDAMRAGAIDFVEKPGSRPGYGEEQFTQDIIQKIKVAATARTQTVSEAASRTPAVRRTTPVPRNITASAKSVIAIGASTGGTEAIIEVIKHFPANMPGVVIVQHMPPVFTKMYAERVDKLCAMKVSEAQNGDRVTTGSVLIAPGGDRQMYLCRDANGYYVQLRAGEKVSGHCPSVDVLFDSVAETAGRNAVGVILTGMGADGAKGLTRMKKTGAYTFGQDEKSCAVYGMPMVAFNMGGVSEQLPLTSIGEAVIRKFL